MQQQLGGVRVMQQQLEGVEVVQQQLGGVTLSNFAPPLCAPEAAAAPLGPMSRKTQTRQHGRTAFWLEKKGFNCLSEHEVR